MAVAIKNRISVLIVEDNAADALLLSELLKGSRAELTLAIARDGQEALDYLHRRGRFAESRRPDFILLDLNLPKKSGRDVLREIRLHPDLKSIPVVILTTSNAHSDIASAYDLHANSYIVKPAELNELASVVASIDHFWFSTSRLPTSRVL